MSDRRGPPDPPTQGAQEGGLTRRHTTVTRSWISSLQKKHSDVYKPRSMMLGYRILNRRRHTENTLHAFCFVFPYTGEFASSWEPCSIVTWFPGRRKLSICTSVIGLEQTCPRCPLGGEGLSWGPRQGPRTSSGHAHPPAVLLSTLHGASTVTGSVQATSPAVKGL